MSEFLTIGLSKKVIFDKIGLFTSYLAGKRSDDYAAFDRVATFDTDIPVLDYASDDAAAFLAAELGEMVNDFKIEGDVIRYIMRNPLPEGSPNTDLLFRLTESYIVAETIIRWLRIVGYEFGEGARQALTSAAEVAATKLKLLRRALTAPSEAPAESGPRIMKARSRRLPPI
ncbi:MAG: hypothetical protein K2H35_02050 [Muribaculaceae bacterium]|nr:hypothetical protein [Muribaculaceae bacterium]